MKKWISVILLFKVISLNLFGQDKMVVPSYNPLLVPQNAKAEKQLEFEKVSVREDSFIYRYDTLNLPFIDDFTSNHLSRRVRDLNDPRLTDTTVYRLYLNGQLVSDTTGFVTDTTFYYQIGADSSIISRTEQFNGIVEVHNLQSFPTTTILRNVYLPYNVYDTVGRPLDTIPVAPSLFQDSAQYYFVDAEADNWYTDRDVLINETFAIDPPTRGVATFDGLNEFGLPYNIDLAITVKADYLTSVPIDLSSTSDTTYFSFFYQPKGLSLDPPERNDSLVLEFYNSTNQRWAKVWGVGGFLADTFTQAFVKVETDFLTNAFQFRFRAYASSAGAFDQWHIDYIYLDDQRTFNDKSVKDITFVNAPPPLLKYYFAMPWWHFKPNPGNFMVDSLKDLRIRSLHDGGLNVFNKVVIEDTVNNTEFYRFPTNDRFSIIPPGFSIDFDYPLNFAYPPTYIDSAGVLEVIADIDFRPGPTDAPDLIRANDTLTSKAILDNYYAYDDGTAEAGYGVNPRASVGGLFSYLAVEYNMPIADTIGGLQIYFLPQRFIFDNNPITSQSFEITIWSGLNPSQVIYQKAERYNPIYTEPNGFITFWLDTLIPVPQNFYIGFKSIGPLSLNVGYDLNNNNRDKTFWSLDGQSWSNPSSGIFDGSSMIRPVFRKKEWGVGLVKQSKNESTAIMVYPNPVREQLMIAIKGKEKLDAYQLFDARGKLVLSGHLQKLELGHLPRGLYFLRIELDNGTQQTKKLVLR